VLTVSGVRFFESFSYQQPLLDSSEGLRHSLGMNIDQMPVGVMAKKAAIPIPVTKKNSCHAFWPIPRDRERN
jgi:hypothetical protein